MRKWKLRRELKSAEMEIARLREELSELSGENEILRNVHCFVPGQLAVTQLPNFNEKLFEGQEDEY